MRTAKGLIEPEPIREKRVYPAFQWWPLRVMNPWHKFGVLVAYTLGERLVVWSLGTWLPHLAESIVVEIVTDVALIAMARSFRGFGEPVGPPRVWWRLTARPLAGWWLGGLWLIASLIVFTSKAEVWAIPSNIGSLLLGLAFLNSSVRLTALRRHPQI